MLTTIITIASATICTVLCAGTFSAVAAELSQYRVPRATFADLCGSTALNSLAAGFGL